MAKTPTSIFDDDQFADLGHLVARLSEDVHDTYRIAEHIDRMIEVGLLHGQRIRDLKANVARALNGYRPVEGYGPYLDSRHYLIGMTHDDIVARLRKFMRANDPRDCRDARLPHAFANQPDHLRAIRLREEAKADAAAQEESA